MPETYDIEFLQEQATENPEAFQDTLEAMALEQALREVKYNDHDLNEVVVAAFNHLYEALPKTNESLNRWGAFCNAVYQIRKEA